MPARFRIPFLLVLLAALALAGCGTQRGAEEAHAPLGSTEKSVTIDVHDAAFRPQTITADGPGEVVVTVENRGRLRHTFTADAPTVDFVLEPGDRRSVRLPAGVPVAFYCRYHEANGMRGVICPSDGECPART